jgi:hypothetical protein
LENVVDTLHKKSLLLLGDDRYLPTLMLKTFPKRKDIFCPQAVCKTVVPDTFRVLLSQRRRWINSTIHASGAILDTQKTSWRRCPFVPYLNINLLGPKGRIFLSKSGDFCKTETRWSQHVV